MSYRSKDGYRWLDSLARWSARGTGDARPPAAPAGQVSVVAGGTTRRTALRTAAGAGAVALFAPMRLLQPSFAGAASTQLAECKSASNETAYGDFEACAKTPLSEFEAASSFIDEAKKKLRSAKTAAERRRLKKVIAYQSRRQKGALNDMGFCNKSFLSDRAEGDARCDAAAPPAGGTGGGGSPPSTAPGCGNDAQYVSCGDQPCCNLSYASCVSCSTGPVCCRNGGNCCG